MKKIIIILLLCITLLSCNTTGCIKVEGDKDGMSGAIEYCFGPKGTLVDTEGVEHVIAKKKDVEDAARLLGAQASDVNLNCVNALGACLDAREGK